MRHYLHLLAMPLMLAACTGQPKTQPKPRPGDPIRINQLGYCPNQEKYATIESEGWAEKYVITSSETGETVWQGPAMYSATSPWSGKVRQVIDFSDLRQTGSYELQAGPYRKTLTVAQHPFRNLAIGATKAFYYQRSGTPIEEKYAGQWHRPAAHPDTCVLVHSSAASSGRPAGMVISSPGGWYDAGDYNKYIVNSGYSTGLMLTSFQLNADQYASYTLNIPESDNTLPDYLDEIKVNLEWMLTMQDADGGVYHKLTTPGFEDFVMPTECHQTRYVVQKGTAATLDFAAAMAQAARVYKVYPDGEDFARRALQAAERAWKWAQRHPDVVYNQEKMNSQHEPQVTTGTYGDGHFDDEFFWAASELYFTTGRKAYLYNASNYAPARDYTYELPSWGNVYGLGIMGWLIQGTFYSYTDETAALYRQALRLVTDYCDQYLAQVPASCYHAPFGNEPRDFGWGCLSEGCCVRGITMLMAYRMTGEARYLTAALECADYLLGRNATGYCYVTGFGQKSPLHPHQRVSASDSIDAPLPGFLVGGPNPMQQDTCQYPSDMPDESYVDITDSYASNEIAINWNASLAAFAGWLDAAIQ